jgi:hypothetical protein
MILKDLIIQHLSDLNIIELIEIKKAIDQQIKSGDKALLNILSKYPEGSYPIEARKYLMKTGLSHAHSYDVIKKLYALNAVVYLV